MGVYQHVLPGVQREAADVFARLVAREHAQAASVMAVAGQQRPSGAKQSWPDEMSDQACGGSSDRRRIGLLAALIGQAVHDHGTAEVIGVPGDPLTALRSRAPELGQLLPVDLHDQRW